jgi:hypothetical protein
MRGKIVHSDSNFKQLQMQPTSSLRALAKQSIVPPKGKNGLLRSARNDGWIQVRILAAQIRASFDRKLLPSQSMAQGKPGADCTRGSRAKKSTGVGPQVQPESHRLSLRDGLRLTSRSPQ